MAKKVILKDQDNIEIMPITRGELITDSSGNQAFHSNQFLATQSQPGLMSTEDKTKLDNLEDADTKVSQVNTTADESYRLLFSYTADDEDRTEGARKSADLNFNPSKGVLSSPILAGNIDGNYIYQLSNYAISTTAEDIVDTDTLNVALGKLEYKADLGVLAYNWYKSVTDEDTDTYINKWDEIVDFLNNVQDTSNIIDEFVTRKTEQEITGQKTFKEQIIITNAEDVAPLSISNAVLVNNLNADLLDGYHASSFMNFSANLVNNYVYAKLEDSSLAKNTGYIQFGDETEGYYNSRWGSVTANGFVKAGSSERYVLLGNGDHKELSDFVLRSEGGNDATVYDKTLTVNQEWSDTGIESSDITSGTYIVQVYCDAPSNNINTCYWSGVMSWFEGATNSNDTDEILLHRASHSYNNNTIYLRTVCNTSGVMKLQIAANTTLASATYSFKFKKMI